MVHQPYVYNVIETNTEAAVNVNPHGPMVESRMLTRIVCVSLRLNTKQ